MSEASPSFSLLRILLIAVPAAAIAWGVKSYTDGFQQEAEAESVKTTVRQMLSSDPSEAILANEFTDDDGDLLADPPQDSADCLNPEEIVFSYFAATEEDDQKETWSTLTRAMSQRLGRAVKYVHFADVDEQIRAMKEGQLHVTAFGTGAVPTAVNTAGFTPICCFADADGKYNYTMKIIVPTGSEIKKVEQLRGKRVTFTRPKSNSGYKAALVMLMDEHDMQPERDYAWGFSYGHDNSIKGIAEREYESAAVASDVLQRAIARGEVEADAIRSIYESDKYPPGVIGYVYNLTPELREGIRETLLAFEVAGTALADEYGAGEPLKFAAVSYKDDWETVRHVNKLVADARSEFE